ncbi:MAG: ABC transporter permease [Methanomassiliicoccaceae archaeon]|nr:ABC transporter permease [Methanomassiliicoccaceae archaeon]
MNKGIKDDLRQIGVVTQYELYKHIRSRRLLIFAGLMALLFILITVLYIYFGGLPNDPSEFMSSYVAFISLLIIVGVSLLCAPAIASEFEERTALLLFPRPIKRTSFFVGKVLACYIVCGVTIIAYYLACMLLSFIVAGGVDVKALGSLGMALLFMLGAGGFAFLMSALFKKGSTAVIITIAMLLLVLGMIEGIMMFFNVEPLFSLTYASLDIMNIIEGNVTQQMAIGGGMYMTLFYPSHLVSVTIMLSYFAVTTALSAFLFKRREF